jgi:hypothetical protein
MLDDQRTNMGNCASYTALISYREAYPVVPGNPI